MKRLTDEEIDALAKDIESYDFRTNVEFGDITDEIFKRLLSDLRAYKTALDVYGNEDNWFPDYSDTGDASELNERFYDKKSPRPKKDWGELARAALGKE